MFIIMSHYVLLNKCLLCYTLQHQSYSKYKSLVRLCAVNKWYYALRTMTKLFKLYYDSHVNIDPI